MFLLRCFQVGKILERWKKAAFRESGKPKTKEAQDAEDALEADGILDLCR